MRSPPALLALLALLAALAGGCGGADDGADASDAATNVAGTPSEQQAKLPRELAELAAQGGELLGGGAEAFKERIDALEGHPVVVNKWASWCGPCRAEFPFFQSQAEKRAGGVAFLGVNSSDDEANAASFLEQYPVPYPSYLDPDLEVAAVFNGVAAFPSTAFYDEKGELVHLKQGGYASEELLAEDIERYAE